MGACLVELVAVPLLQTKKSAAHQSAAALHDGPSAAEEAAQAEQDQAEKSAAPAAGDAVAGPATVAQHAPAAAAEASAGATSGSRQKGGKRASKAATKKGGKPGTRKGQAAALTEAPLAEGLPASSAAERRTDRDPSAEAGQHEGESADNVAPVAAADGQAEADQPAKRATGKSAKGGPNKSTGAAKSCKSTEPALNEAATAAVQGLDKAAGPAAVVAAASTDAAEQQSEAAAGSGLGAGKPEVQTTIDSPICLVPPSTKGSAGEATVHCYVIHTLVEIRVSGAARGLLL